MEFKRKNRLPAGEYIQGIRDKDKVILSKAITLVESTLPEDNELAEQVIEQILPETGNSIRIGITGIPGVGKSTFINAFGKYITSTGKKLAVLAVDPSSLRSKGSILGDKTRMEDLSTDPNAYIRPTASGSNLGGVAWKTRESLLLCEAAGYEIIFIETVGVGQSETLVHEMVDFFLLLILSGAGDELQGMKRGIIELADSIIITKSDGDNLKKAEKVKRDYENAMHLFPPGTPGWTPRVLMCSALKKQGLGEIWDLIQENIRIKTENGHFIKNRHQQQVDWMHRIIQHGLESEFYNDPSIKKLIKTQENLVASGKIVAFKAAGSLLHKFKKHL